MTITTATSKRTAGRSGRNGRNAALLSAGALALAGVLVLCCYAPVQPAEALFWPRLGFSGGFGGGFGGGSVSAFDDVWDQHFRAIDHLNAVTSALLHPHTRVSTTRAAAAAAQQQHKHWQPVRAADSAWDRLIAAQAKQWACSAHCRARTRATLPYEAAVSERTDGCRAGAGAKCSPADVEIALRLPNVKPNDVHVQVVGGDTLSIRATRAPRTHAPNALDAECGCAQAHDQTHADATDAAAAVESVESVESVERTYSLGRFVDADRITATISQQPDTAEGAAAGDFVTTVTVTVPKAVRPDTKRIALSEVAAAVEAPAAVAAIAAPETTAETTAEPAVAAAVESPAAAPDTAAEPAAAAPAAEEPQFGTTAVAANSAAAPVRVTSDATDEVINL